MTEFRGLIRLNRWQVDERRRELAALEEFAAKLAEDRRKLEAEDVRERAAAAASPETAYAYAAYARVLVGRRNKLQQSQDEVAEQVARARDALAEAFQELKRYEIAAENRTKLAEQREARRQQQVMDDLGIEGFRRKTAGGEQARRERED
jgi:flagellar FliJ protein